MMNGHKNGHNTYEVIKEKAHMSQSVYNELIER